MKYILALIINLLIYKVTTAQNQVLEFRNDLKTPALKLVKHIQ
ncbi:MAG: hypothetical protein R2785_12450 [Flavobacteriaceae bacterium]